MSGSSGQQGWEALAKPKGAGAGACQPRNREADGSGFTVAERPEGTTARASKVNGHSRTPISKRQPGRDFSGARRGSALGPRWNKAMMFLKRGPLRRGKATAKKTSLAKLTGR